MSWGKDGGKSQSPVRLGDVVSVAKGTTISKVNRKLTWEDTTIKEFPDKVTLGNKNNNKQWPVAEVDTLGNYTTMLPKGQYLAKPFWEFHRDYHIDVENSKSFFEVKPIKGNQATDLTQL